MKTRKNTSLDELDAALDDLAKSFDEDEDLDDDLDLDEDDEQFEEEEEEEEKPKRKKKGKKSKKVEEEEEEDIDDDRELSSQFEEEELEWDDDDDTYTTGKARSEDKSYGGVNPGAKRNDGAEYSSYYKKIMGGRTGQKPENAVTMKSMSFDRDAQNAIDVSPFLRNITKSMNGSMGELANVLLKSLEHQQAFNQKLAKAVTAQGRLLRGVMTQPNMRKSMSYDVLRKGAENHGPDRRVVQRVLEKSVTDGEISQDVLTNFEISGQLSPEARYLLQSKGL